MRFVEKLKNKAVITYLTLALGLVFSVFINISFVSERAVNSLTQLQQEHTKLQVQSSFNNIQQFIENRVKLLAELAESPIVTSSVMGVELVAANLADLLNQRKILGSKENIYIADFTGELIYPNNGENLNRVKVVENIINQQTALVLQVIEIDKLHYFSISKPIQYNAYVEGIITFDIVSQSIESLLAELTQDKNYAVKLEFNNDLIFETTPLQNYSLVSNFALANTAMQISFYTSTEKLLAEKQRYVWQIGSTLTATTLIAFLLLAVLIRSLLLNPLEKLALSEKQTKLSEERYQLAIQGSNDGIWDWNIEKNALYLSPRLANMTGYKKNQGELVDDPDKVFFDYIHSDDVLNVKQEFEQCFESKHPLDCEFRVRVADGNIRFFRMRGIAQHNSANKPTRMAGSLTDITERKLRNQALNKALQQAKSASLAKSQFLANMSHEIRTPMNGVLGSLQVLKREELSESAQKMVDLGISSSKNLLSIINDILDLSKIESKNISLESLPTNIVELFKSIVTELSQLAEQKNIGLVFSHKENMHPFWLVDPVRLRQIAVNMLSNAIKFTSVGQVDLYLGELDGNLVFEVKDSGIGIPKSQIQKLFNRFEQADATTTRNYGGTGLGLPIAKQLTILMGGEIEIESEVNVGSSFKVTLPLKKTEVSTHNLNVLPSTQTPDAAHLSFLLAEDNEINQVIFTSLVGPTNAKITIANDGIEAIEKVELQQPDLIFMDIQMPNMDGMQACQIIKASHPTIPIIALTANVMSQDVAKYKQIGFDYCLGKPINVDEIFELIQTCCH